MTVPVKVQLKGESEPQQRLALVFDDVYLPDDLIPYRNALTMACKEVTSSEDGNYLDEVFWLLQLAEFISSSLDDELERRRKSISDYQKHIARANNTIFQEVLKNLKQESNEQQ